MIAIVITLGIRILITPRNAPAFSQGQYTYGQHNKKNKWNCFRPHHYLSLEFTKHWHSIGHLKKLWNSIVDFKKTLRMKSFMILLLGGLIFTSFKTERPVTSPTTINPLHAVQVTDAAGLLTNGELDVNQFVCNNGRIWAVCKLRGVVGGIHVDADCLVPVTVGDCDGGIRLTSDKVRTVTAGATNHDCECLTITFDGCTITPTGPLPTTPTLSILPQDVQCGVQDFPGDALCCANTLIGNPTSSIYDICSCMNRLL
jgi:hypothetical protein